MNDRPRHSVQPEQLPADFAPSLCEVDALLAKQARQIAPAADLADRVFAASRPALLAATSQPQTTPRLRFVPAPRPIHQTPWARLAMAACVVLACAAAFWVLQPSQPHSTRVVIDSAHAPADHSATLLASLDDVPHATTASHYEANISYLIESHNISVDDLDQLKTELAMFVARF